MTAYAEERWLIRIAVATKHGPNGKGGPGGCDEACVKCEAEARLKAARAGVTALPDPDARDALQRLGLPVEAMMRVRARYAACAPKHGVRPGESRTDRTADDHWRAALRHLDAAGVNLTREDEDDPGTHLEAAVCRLLLAVEVGGG